jgi:hypothetical protein
VYLRGRNRHLVRRALLHCGPLGLDGAIDVRCTPLHLPTHPQDRAAGCLPTRASPCPMIREYTGLYAKFKSTSPSGWWPLFRRDRPGIVRLYMAKDGYRDRGPVSRSQWTQSGDGRAAAANGTGCQRVWGPPEPHLSDDRGHRTGGDRATPACPDYQLPSRWMGQTMPGPPYLDGNRPPSTGSGPSLARDRAVNES